MTPPLDISGLVDSLLLTVLVCGFSLLIRRDVTLRLLVVLSVLLVCSIVARFAALPPLIRVMDAIFFSVPVVLAVIFQQDLRRSLLALGSRQKLSAVSVDDITEMTDEILKALASLASRHIGALIVLVRRHPVEHLLQVGTDIDAKVTSELLDSIFLPYSPIHDGAVIINQGKITRAGCLLPLSHNPDIAKSFGTRHRAALGLSEATDALVLVVSEETGKISCVHDARITYDIDLADLKRLVRKSLELQHAA
ncbi:diadenylate cyclase CdaA [Trichlorobacter ammonificans]|uniref:Diadenylate cyclase n=1 Tax=Trichlorobacter ammonificans TaxID=2916410 RepID=A0ABN8HKJ5_9BACT|nr:diadenylate cyclase CdaA [Trichlorobacter ammonificans]CAH2031566.1 Diadenylate cyclase [Trichlorobacter ammonificans]